MAEAEGDSVIVLDNSSYTLKVGFDDDEIPQGLFKPFVAKDGTIGDNAVIKMDEMDVRRPFERGLITNWEDMERVWNYSFTEKLKLKNLEERSVLMSEHPLNPKAHREKIVSLFFEKFKVPALFLQMQPVLSVYGSGKSSGLVIEAGESMTNIMPVFDGFPLHSSRLRRLDIGGGDLHKYMLKSIEEQHLYDFKTPGQRWAIHTLQDTLFRVAPDYDDDGPVLSAAKAGPPPVPPKLSKTASERAKKAAAAPSPYLDTSQFRMPDGKMIDVGSLRYQVPESLFQPKKFLDVEEEGLHLMVAKCINGCEPDIRKAFYENIVLAGGVTMFPGFTNRLNTELKKLIPSNIKFVINDQPDRNLSAWIGGAILAELPQFPSVCITRYDFNEDGPQVVHTKCPR